jgi:hypothetical protein
MRGVNDPLRLILTSALYVSPHRSRSVFRPERPKALRAIGAGEDLFDLIEEFWATDTDTNTKGTVRGIRLGLGRRLGAR